MQNTQFNINKLFFILTLAINKKIIKIEISFLEIYAI